MDKNKDFLHDLWYVSGVNEDIWSTLIDNYNNAPAKEEKDHALSHIKWHLGYKMDDGKLKEIEEKIDSCTKVKLTFTANEDTAVDVYFTKESFDSNKPDDTISLTANEEKTTTYDRESIYKFKVMYTSNPSRPWESHKNYNIEYSKIEGKLLDCSNLFKYCIQLTTVDISKLNPSTDISNMFYGCSSLTTLNLSNFDTSNVTNMNAMFIDCSNLTSLDLSNLDMSKATDISWMFYGCSSLTALNLSNWNTSNVTNMIGMFNKCSALTTLDISKCDTFNVTAMNNMFQKCSSLIALDLSNWNISNVTNIEQMFYDCSKLTTIGQVNTAPGWQHKPNNYTNMFTKCPATPKPTWYTE